MITDKMLYEAAKEVNEVLVQSVEKYELENIYLSERFERKMRRLIRKVKYPYLYHTFKTVASLMLVFLISFASVIIFNVEARADFVKWVKEVYEDSIVYEFWGAKSYTSLDYRVTWIPAGYNLVDENISEHEYIAVYQNDNAGMLVFNCYALSEGNYLEFLIDDEEYVKKETLINGSKAEFYESSIVGESNNLIWFDESGNVGFNINSTMSYEDIVKIAENIEYKK